MFEVPDIASYSHTGSIGNIGQAILEKRLDEVMFTFKEAYSPAELAAAIIGTKGLKI